MVGWGCERSREKNGQEENAGPGQILAGLAPASSFSSDLFDPKSLFSVSCLFLQPGLLPSHHSDVVTPACPFIASSSLLSSSSCRTDVQLISVGVPIAN